MVTHLVKLKYNRYELWEITQENICDCNKENGDDDYFYYLINNNIYNAASEWGTKLGEYTTEDDALSATGDLSTTNRNYSEVFVWDKEERNWLN